MKIFAFFFFANSSECSVWNLTFYFWVISWPC